MKITISQQKNEQASQMLKISLFFILITFITGCADKTSQVKLPQDVPVKWDFSVNDETTLSTNKLLDLLDDPAITKLAQEAMRNNPDIGATSDRLLAQAALLGVSKSRLWPSIDLDLTTGRGNRTPDSEGEHQRHLFSGPACV